MNVKLSIVALLLILTMISHASDDFPPLHVSGNQLVNEQGKVVTLHGVMDTPNRYFNGDRWQEWKAGYNDEDVQPCLDYFEKLFTAISDRSQGCYCTVFRLHLDPCWTNDPNKTLVGEGGEHNISQFSAQRLVRYWKSLYSKLMEKALAHGLYVILRPPGVCPKDIKVGDDYQSYLKTVWGTVTQANVLKEHSGHVSIELANEPVHVYAADGSSSKSALRDFFQPVVDIIRDNGFNGVIWVPGAGYQSQYSDYAQYPINDVNFGYAVHVYPGWYGASDKSYNHNAFISQFHVQVPVVDTNPIMVTEIDWSPENPDGEGKYDEWGEWVKPNYGTWGTASTSKWGNAWKAVHDHYGNIGMTLTSTDDLIDIDEYLNSGMVRPNFSVAGDLYQECCAYTCFQWYKEFYEAQATGIESIDALSPIPQPSPVSTRSFDLMGRPVGSNHHGICIIKTDGKAKKMIKSAKCNK